MSNGERVSRGTFHSMAVEKLKLESQLHSLTEENERLEHSRDVWRESSVVESKGRIEAEQRAARYEEALSEILGALPQSYDFYRSLAKKALSPIDPPLAPKEETKHPNPTRRSE